MKKTITLLGLIAMTGYQAFAIEHILLTTPGVFILPNGTYNGSFNLLSPGATPPYNPLTEQITSATAIFMLADPSANFGAAPETITISLEGSFFASAQNFFIYGPSGNVEVSLLDDNVLTYSIVSGPNSSVGTWLTVASLQWTTAARSSVPDGGTTLAMLGFGLVGLGYIRKSLFA